MKNNKNFGEVKTKLYLILICFIISCFVIIATTPLHEAAHWVMSDIDPYIEPVELHLFDETSFKNGQHILSSALGCVIVKEKYPGAFKDRPILADVFQEIICISIQIVIACIIVSKTLTFILNKKYTNLLKK